MDRKSWIIGLFFVIPNICSFPQLPDDLMYNGKPIHPHVVDNVRPVMGETLPRSVVYDQAGHYPYAYNKDTGYIECCMPDNHCRYIYIGTYKNKHLVQSTWWGGGSGIFTTLGLLERRNTMIMNAGDLAAGDRWHGGAIAVESFKKNRVRFSLMLMPHDIVQNLIGKWLGWSACGYYGIYLIYEVDLDLPISSSFDDTKIVGMRFDRKNDLFQKNIKNYKTLSRTSIEYKFWRLIDQWSSKKLQLNEIEVEMFKKTLVRSLKVCKLKAH